MPDSPDPRTEAVEPRTEAGRKLLRWGEPTPGYVNSSFRAIIAAVESEARRDAYDSVLRGLHSEDDTLQLRAIIASVETDRDR